jgi:spore maturation protein CgeB
VPEPRLILVGNPDIVHVGAHLHKGALDSGYVVSFLNSKEAFRGPALVAKLNWWLRGRRPTFLHKFSQTVLEACREFQPDFLLATGIAPIASDALRSIGSLGIHRLNYLTDDPWNPHHKAPWFMDSLSHYDHVFSPRRANLEDLHKLDGPEVSYLPFAYAPQVHFADPPASEEESMRFASDVVFAGGADSDRVRYADALIREGFHVALYGGYWDRYPQTRRFALGLADPPTLRKAIGGSKVALCLVRRANRDGHSMRTFELAASGACILAEDTIEHREILGEDGAAAVYFRTIPEMVGKLRWLLEHPDDRRRLMAASQRWIVTCANTYGDRLAAMLGVSVESTK